MRNWMVLMAAGVGLAAAQETQTARPPAETPKPEVSKPDEKKPDEQQQALEQLKKFQALDRALRRSRESEKSQVKPNSPTPCAIPLLNVLKAAPGVKTAAPDPMIIVPPEGAPKGAKGDQIQVPAPSCDDVKKDEGGK